MHVYDGLPESPIGDVALSVGSFDGVHLGHQDVIRRLRNGSGAATVITFEPHPRCVLDPSRCPKSLTTPGEKTALLDRYGIEHAITLKFTPDLARLTPDEFMVRIAAAMSVQKFVCGPDFAFGRARAGNADWLRDHGFEVEVAPPFQLDGVELHSSEIRRLLIDVGDIEAANRLLGDSRFMLWGTVEHGAEVGRAIGFPTANLALPLNKLIPRPGIYAARVRLGAENRIGAVSVGFRPTFGGDRLVVEVYVLDFDGDLYGHQVGVEVVKRLRDEARYPSAAALAEQIARDVEETRRLLG